MKLSNIALCLTSAALMLSANAFADNSTGSVHITGQVLDATCTIDASQLNQTVDLGAIQSSALTAVGPGAIVTSKPVNFTLTNCPKSLDKLGIRFNYTADAAGNYMENTGTAKGVLLGISNPAETGNTAIATGASIGSLDYDPTAGGNATINAQVNAYRIGTDTPTEGTIASVSQVVVAYN